MTILLFFFSFFLGIVFHKSYVVVGISILLLIGILIRRRSPYRISLLVLGVFLIGFGVSFINISYPQKESYEGIVYETKDNYFLFNSGLERFYCYEKEHTREVGDVLVIKGSKEELDFVTLESQFDFTNYLKDKGVNSSLEIKKVTVKYSNIIRLNSFKRFFLNKFDEKTRISVNSILFSDHDSNELTDTISSLHLTRLISAGGLYLNALLGGLTALFYRKLDKKWAKLCALGVSGFYIVSAFNKFSIIRLTIIFIFKWINEYLLKKRFSYLEVLSLTGLFFLIIDYHLAVQHSFILGFGIPIYLYFINNSFIGIKNIVKRLLVIPLIYLFFIPFEISYFHSVSPLSIIYQFILIPGFILFFLLTLISLYGLPIYPVVNFCNRILTNIVSPFSKLNLEIYSIELPSYVVLFYYLILLLFLYYSSIGFRPIKKALIGIYVTGLSICLIPISNFITQEVSFLNVGQGDCCYIRDGNSVIFIDTGGLKYTDLATESIIPFLKKKRVYDIDLVITTHDDYDHNGALSSLKSHFKVKRTMTNFTYQTVSFGNLTFTNYNNHIVPGGEDNEVSLVVGFSLGGRDYLITGDASKEIESNIMKEYKSIPCDILKVGHHGSKTSTSDAFIKWLKPEVGIISCGKNNRYGHPHQEVIAILKNNNVKIRRTDLEGTITYSSFRSIFI